MEEQKRGRGRPRNDEIVAQSFTPHKRPQIKEKNKEKYAKQTIRRADQLCKKYAEPVPNPLNLDKRELTKEAREMWKYIFSLRGDDVNNITFKAKALRSADETLFALECFCAYIRNNNFVKEFERPDGSMGMMPIVPNTTNLAMWLGISSCRLRSILRDMDSVSQGEYKALLGDLLSDGAIAGVYSQSPTIFTLKNLCDWADKREDRVVQVEDTSSVEEAKMNLEALGYMRPRLLEGGKNE